MSTEIDTKALVAAVGDAIVVCDTQGSITLWNAAAEYMFGYSSAEAMGQSLDLIIPERMRKAHWDGFDQAIARGGVKPGRAAMMTRSLHKAKESIYVEMSFSMVSDAAGALIGSLAVAREATVRFTEEKALRKQLAELTAQK